MKPSTGGIGTFFLASAADIDHMVEVKVLCIKDGVIRRVNQVIS